MNFNIPFLNNGQSQGNNRGGSNNGGGSNRGPQGNNRGPQNTGQPVNMRNFDVDALLDSKSLEYILLK